MAATTFRTLAELAHWHHDQSFRLFGTLANRRGHRKQSAFYSQMLASRAATDPARLPITGALPMSTPNQWCRRHGYRATPTVDGVLVQRDSEPALIANLGDTLVWDGQNITVQTE